MRKLNYSDVARFSIMIDATGVREIVANGTKQAVEEGLKKRNQLLDLKRKIDEAQNPIQRDDYVRRLLTVQKDDAAIYRIGIDTVMQILTTAARNGAMDSINAFLMPIFEVSEKELQEMPLEEFKNLLKQLAKENDLIDFFDLPGLLQAKP